MVYVAQGGICYSSEEEFQVFIGMMDEQVINQLGLQGKKNVEKSHK